MEVGRVERALARHLGTAVHLRGMQRLTYGASAETWALDAVAGDVAHFLILRRPPHEPPGDEAGAILFGGRRHEMELLGAVAAAGLPVPRVHFALAPDDGMGEGFVMERLPGAADPPATLRDPAFAAGRDRLPRQLAGFRSGLDAIDEADLPPLRRQHAAAMIDDLERLADLCDLRHPAIEVALAWLREHAPPPGGAYRLVHGDFRLANFMITPEGLCGVIDWEMAHLGDPAEDLAWACLRSWRFSRPDLAAAGVAPREALYEAYAGAGGRSVGRREILFWEVLGNLRWALICAYQERRFLDGARAGLEFAAVGRRLSEPLYDLLGLIDEGLDG